MFDNDKLPASSETRASRPLYLMAGLPSRPRSYFAAAVVACGCVLAAGGFVATASGMDRLGFGRGAHMAFLQFAVARTLDSVGASSAQEAKAHDIIADKFAKMVSDLDEFPVLRQRAIAIVAAPHFDREAAEKLRSEAIARLDAESKLALAGFADIADLLEPAQRVELAAQLEHGGPMGGRPPGGPGFGPDRD